MNRVTIASDGTSVNTKVSVDGTPLDNCSSVVIRIDARRRVAEVTLTLYDVPIDLDGQVCIDYRGTGRIPKDHSDHGRGYSEEGPNAPDCPCRRTDLEKECRTAGCGFCRE